MRRTACLWIEPGGVYGAVIEHSMPARRERDEACPTLIAIPGDVLRTR